jgi:hypothetical protein
MACQPAPGPHLRRSTPSWNTACRLSGSAPGGCSHSVEKVPAAVAWRGARPPPARDGTWRRVGTKGGGWLREGERVSIASVGLGGHGGNEAAAYQRTTERANTALLDSPTCWQAEHCRQQRSKVGQQAGAAAAGAAGPAAGGPLLPAADCQHAAHKLHSYVLCRQWQAAGIAC